MKQIYSYNHILCYQVGGSSNIDNLYIFVTTKKLYECILNMFGCPLTIVIDQGVHFINDAMKYLTNHFLLKHVSSITYYP
jgi:hypothetical protein